MACSRSLQKDVEILGMSNRTSLRFILRGSPIAQPAPRLANRPGRRNAIIYNSVMKKIDKIREVVREALSLKVGELFFPSGTALEVEVLHFFLARPKYHFKSNGPRNFENLRTEYKKEGIPVRTKPDLDNLEKFLFDALEGVIFDDDKCIVAVYDAAKCYDCHDSCDGQILLALHARTVYCPPNVSSSFKY